MIWTQLCVIIIIIRFLKSELRLWLMRSNNVWSWWLNQCVKLERLGVCWVGAYTLPGFCTNADIQAGLNINEAVNLQREHEQELQRVFRTHQWHTDKILSFSSAKKTTKVFLLSLIHTLKLYIHYTKLWTLSRPLRKSCGPHVNMKK